MLVYSCNCPIQIVLYVCVSFLRIPSQRLVQRVMLVYKSRYTLICVVYLSILRKLTHTYRTVSIGQSPLYTSIAQDEIRQEVQHGI